MYKIFGFEPDRRFGRVARVEFSISAELGKRYVYLLGNFNAFNEGSFRMRKEKDRWRAVVKLPEGVWHYAFSIDGGFTPDPENPWRETYRRLSYKFERETSVAVINGGDGPFHAPSATYLYSIAGRTHVLLRAKVGTVAKATLVLPKSEGIVEMRRKARDELFEYFEAVLSGDGELEYSFEVRTREGPIRRMGPFRAVPYRPKTPRWVYERVFYQIMPDRFERSLPGTPGGGALRSEEFHGGDLAGIIKRLDHIEGLGVNALYLTPIFESMTYHRYDVTDYFRIDGKLGGWGVFRELVQELRSRGIRLILDGVFHHTSFFHPFFQDLIDGGNKSDYKDFYRATGFPVVSDEFTEILRSELPWHEKYRRLKNLDWNYESFYSVWLMPRLNHDSPEVRWFVGKVMRYWLESADGWRLDVAHGVPPELWREVRKALPKDAYLIGEVMDDARLWLFDVFHGTMNYPLYELMLRFFVEGEITAEEFLNGLELLSAYYGPAEYAMYNFLDNHDTERFIDLVGDERKYLCALAFMMTYKGVPSISYGDEIGLGGSKGNGLDPGRTPMEWDKRIWNRSILKATKELVRLRQRSKALQLGEFRPLSFKDRLILYERVYGAKSVLVGINYSQETKTIDVPRDYLPREKAELAPWSFIVLER